jgi:YD repeat-containing protein
MRQLRTSGSVGGRGGQLSSPVYPPGSANRPKRRHKATNTSSNNSSDLVHIWAYTSNFVTSYTDPEGNATTYTRDLKGNVTKVTFPTVTSPVSQSADKDMEYNARGQVTKITDEEEKVVQLTYFGVGTNYGLLEKREVDPTGLDLETVYTYECARRSLDEEEDHDLT